MFRISCLFLCVYVTLVNSNNQYQQATCPYNRLNYGNTYGSPAIIMHQPSPYTQQPSPYTQQYILQNIPNYQPRNSITNLQQSYLGQILSNPAIQAFIDPSTKIYNQNGVEISDQIRPTPPNVVNNYFILPTDYLNENIKRKARTHDYNKASIAGTSEVRQVERKPRFEKTDSYKLKPDLNIEKVRPYDKEHKPRYRTRSRPKHRNSNLNKQQIKTSSNPQRSEKRIINDLTNSQVLFDDKIYNTVETKNNIKRQDMTQDTHFNEVLERVTSTKKNNLENKKESSVVRTEEREVTPNENKRKYTKLPSEINEVKSSASLDRELFDVSKECVKLDNGNIRNSVDNKQNIEPNRESSKGQDNFMKQWMAYIKSFTPMHNFDSLDLAKFNLPYNYEQMHQFSKPPNSSTDSSPASKNRRRKASKSQRKSKQQGIDNSHKNPKNEPNKTSIEIVPTFEFKSTPVLTDVIKVKSDSNMDIPIIKSLEATHYVTDVSTENTPPIMYEIIDYYPDFTKDAVYLTDEDDLYYFHNRHFYGTKEEDEFNRENSKYEGKRDSSVKQVDKSNIRNDIPTAVIDTFKDHRKPVFEELKFQTPPTLIDPGFETRKVNVRDKENGESKANDVKYDRTTRNNVDTVFAKSKVVKYGHQEGVMEKPKVTDELRVGDKPSSNRERIHNPKDGDTTVVFSKSWK